MGRYGNFKKIDLPFKEIEEVSKLIKNGDYTFIRESAMQNWLKDLNPNNVNDMTARAWTLAVMTVLSNLGYEIKKKE